MSSMRSYSILIANILKPYSAILFLNNSVAGLLLLVTTFINPSVALSGIVAVISTILFAELLNLREVYLSQGFYIYNSLLVGMGVGYIFTPTLISIILIAIAASLTFMFSFILNRLFGFYKIPILSLPFSVVMMFIYLASLKYSGLLSTLVNNATIYDIKLPLAIGGFFKSFATIFFLPNTIAGILMVAVVLYFSRIMVIMSLVGYYFGIFIHSYLIGSMELALYGGYAFNYILVAVALCGIFLLPTVKNFLLALVGVAISVVLTDAIGVLFSYYSIPVFTLPFNITVITFIFTLSVIYYREFNTDIKSTPEKSLSAYLSRVFRFGAVDAKISPPFSGKWHVYQAFDDEWTHQGKYRYAYDFVKNREGRSYRRSGQYTSDYYCFGESVLAPVSGYIVDVRDDLIDNAIGEVDRINNWGNYIIIKSDTGFFVEISHLMQYSLSYKIGDYVKEGSSIAKCGNSGYSPQPHLHVQVQDIGVLGGFTKEFVFGEYIKGETLLLNMVPKKGEEIFSVISDRGISSRFLFILDDVFKYHVFKEGRKVEEIEFVVKMNEFGEFYLSDEAANKLYFYNNSKQFYFYNYIGGDSYLKQLFILAPRVPFLSTQKVYFIDYLPINLLKNRLESSYIELISTVKKEFYKIECRYSFDSTGISSEFGSVFLEPYCKGFAKMKYDNIILRRVE